LFANPIPEEFSIPKAEIDLAINQAVQEAADQGFHGHLNTPFILSRIKDLTKGNSIPANRALIESNVKMATQVAVEFYKITAEYKRREAPRQPFQKMHREAKQRKREAIIASAAIVSSPLASIRSGSDVTHNDNKNVMPPGTPSTTLLLKSES
jgi:hypothetical protein